MPRRDRPAIAVGAVVLGALLACADMPEKEAEPASTPPAVSPAAAESSFRSRAGREWELARLGPDVLPPSVAPDPRIPPGDPHPGVRPTIRFDADRGDAGGRSFCNGYGGPYTVRGDSLRIRQIMSSAVGCDGPDSLETRFFRGLRETRRFEFHSDTLGLIAADGSRLTFVPKETSTIAR